MDMCLLLLSFPSSDSDIVSTLAFFFLGFCYKYSLRSQSRGRKHFKSFFQISFFVSFLLILFLFFHLTRNRRTKLHNALLRLLYYSNFAFFLCFSFGIAREIEEGGFTFISIYRSAIILSNAPGPNASCFVFFFLFLFGKSSDNSYLSVCGGQFVGPQPDSCFNSFLRTQTKEKERSNHFPIALKQLRLASYLAFVGGIHNGKRKTKDCRLDLGNKTKRMSIRQFTRILPCTNSFDCHRPLSGLCNAKSRQVTVKADGHSVVTQ